MSWNNGPYPPPDPNQFPGGQPGYGQQPFPGAAGYPPMGGYPPQGGYPPPGGFPGQGYPPGAPGFAPPPQGMPFGHAPPPGSGFNQPGEGTPFSNRPDMYGTNYTGGEDGDMKEGAFDFSDKSIRRGFIRKVYSILMMQLTITLGFIALFIYHRPTQQYVATHPALMIAAIVVFIVSMISLACCGELRRKSPINFILLTLFTVAESFFLGMISSRYHAEEVVMAVGITAAVCLGLTLFAFQTKWDFTVMGGILFVAVIILLIFGIVAIFLPKNKIVGLVYASLGALIFSIYLIYDTQMMMGGNHKYSISPEEYIFAALNLYLDIINIFTYILAIIGSSRD